MDGHSSRILLIEDNAGDAGLVVEALRRHDVACEVSVIADGEHAVRHIEEIEAATERCPDLVILDLNLPKKSGAEVMSLVCSGVPIVVLTSSDQQRDRDSVAAFQLAGYVTKPCGLQEFMQLGAEFQRVLTTLR